MEDRSALFNQLKEFSQRKLKKVETKVVTGLGEQLVEKRGAKGLQVLSGSGATGGGATEANQEPARKLDLQVGFILPGLLMGSQDVAHDKSSLESYGIEYILNLDRDVANKFEDDYNYKNVPITDTEDFELEKVLDECFDFIDDGRHRSNVYIHCSGTVGLSRTTAICIAYLMNKEKQSFEEAFNNVKEARSFVKPNGGFIKQLKNYEVKLRGAAAVKESGIDDPFALRKKQEIEQEKAMVAGAASVKNRMKMFGATLDANSAPRSKSVSPMPGKETPSQTSQPASKWGAKPSSTQAASKSMTPEPRQSWRDNTPASKNGMPPPPPPMPASGLHANDKSTSSKSSSSNKSFPPPPPPPQPPAGSLLKSDTGSKSSHTTSPAKPPSTAYSHKPPVQKQQDARKPSISESSDEERKKMVFGRRPPPAMKIRGGLSIERNDSVSSDKQPANTKTVQTRTFKQPLNLDLIQTNESNALSARCRSPLVLMNNVTPSPSVQEADSRPKFDRSLGQKGNSEVVQELEENPFEYWQRTLRQKSELPVAHLGQAPARTVSLGPRRPKEVSSILQNNPFLRELREPTDSGVSAQTSQPASRRKTSESFHKAAKELESSLTELNELIHSPEIGSSATLGRRPLRTRQEREPNDTPLVGRNNGLRMVKIEGEDRDESSVPRWQWQEDLSNWKMSSSVNDLRSMFNQPVKENEPPHTSSSLRPPSSASIMSNKPPVLSSTLRQNPWLDGSLTSKQGTGQDYAIRRTTSVSSSASSAGARPLLRNPYRGKY